MTASHNTMNQITTLGGGGRTMVAGSLDEPGQVAVGLAGQGDHPARMLAGNRFETELDLPAGTSTLQITATDASGNTAQKQYTVATAPQTARTFTHDADGNLTSDGVRTYEWDAWSRLTKITWATGKTTDISYNALGQRSKLVHTDGGTTRTEYLLYDGAELLQRRTNGTEAANTDRVYFAQGERRKTGSTWGNQFYTRDHLGSVREVLAANGALLARYDYTPYGERESRHEASGYEGTDFGFTGHITLKSPVTGQRELVLAHFRAYDPVIGRWLSQDPIREAGGVNLYGYVGGRVTGASDLLGLEGWEYGSQGYHWFRDRQPGADSYILEFDHEGKPTFKPKPGHSFPGKDWCENHFNEQMKNPEWKAQRRKDIAALFDDPALADKSRATKLGRGLRKFGRNAGHAASLVGLLFMFSNHEAEAAEVSGMVRRWLNQPKGNGAALALKMGGLIGLGDAGTSILIYELEDVEDCP